MRRSPAYAQPEDPAMSGRDRAPRRNESRRARSRAAARWRGCARAKRPACRACPGKSGCSRRRPGASAWYSSSTLWPTRKALSCSRKRFAALRLDGWLQVVRQRSHYDRRHRTRSPRSQEPSLVWAWSPWLLADSRMGDGTRMYTRGSKQQTTSQ